MGAVDVELVQLSNEAIHALARGDLPAADAAAGSLTLTPYLVSPACLSTWRMRRDQLEREPGAATWITRVVVAARSGQVVGRAGFHGPPDPDGMVEVGYSIDPAYRRRGFARAALVALLQRAAREPEVRKVRATISPDNLASRALVGQYGFVEVGEQWDDEDGLEVVFERSAVSAASPPA